MISVPTAKRAKPPIAAPGKYVGTVASMEEPSPANANQYVVGWRCVRGDDTWDLVQLCETEADMADVMVDLGLAGEVEPSACVGLSATVEVVTFANHSYSRVVDTEPLAEA